MKDILTYVLDNFSLYYDCDTSLITYGNPAGKINISKDAGTEFFDENHDIDTSRIVWKSWMGKSIPFLFAQYEPKDIISEHHGQITINVDIIASAFYFLSGWNENFIPKDELGRVEFGQSIMAKLELIELPVVNYYFDILKTAIEKIAPISKRNLWETHDTAVVLTHDIDTCQSGWLEDSFHVLKKGKILTVIKLVLQRLFGKDSWFNLKDISKLEKHHNAKSSFYFLPQKGRKGKQKNADYNIGSHTVKKLISTLDKAGHDIGIHGSFGTHEDADQYRADMARIPVRDIKGNRFHYLMWDNEHSIPVLEKNGIVYDSTLGFSEHIGFRRGTCYPFYLYDFKNKKISGVLEIPMNVMDVSLKKPRYMGLPKSEILPRIEKLMLEVSKFNGVLTILWHNNYFSHYKYAGWAEIYEQILEMAKEQNATMIDGYTVYERIVK
jgi:peptidoglycan/xylan/chitin deacetylase (PgdA/CDA1 family)